MAREGDRSTVWSEAVTTRRRRPQASMVCGLGLLVGPPMLGVCAAPQPISGHPIDTAASSAGASARPTEIRMWMTVRERRFEITLADTPAAHSFASQLPLALDLSDLNGNEKYADLPRALPTDASRPGTIRTGDLMLYGPKTLVIFYQTFESSYSYTRLGRVHDSAGLKRALGEGNVPVAFSKT